MTEKEKIIKKIKKLLSLSKSPNENEACAAIEKAQQLMKDFELSEKEVFLNSIVEGRVKATIRNSVWRNILLNNLAKMYSCGVVHDYNNADFIGEEIDVLFATEVYSYLQKSILRIAKNKIHKNAKTKYRESFKKGLACGLADKLLTMNAPLWRSKEAERKMDLVKMYMKGLDLVIRKEKKRSVTNAGFEKGFLSRDDVSLNNQVNGQEEKKQCLIG